MKKKATSATNELTLAETQAGNEKLAGQFAEWLYLGYALKQSTMPELQALLKQVIDETGTDGINGVEEFKQALLQDDAVAVGNVMRTAFKLMSAEIMPPHYG